ncbi:methyltransferase domain-containing protein [Bernardetia sp.]|uniref:methyltransferase domain-containing protein n=1 Tax=Bernardetia sp. TaxID=1937974 RepID=UPI0025C544D7|nr:methyltransferase domain-containing protein [Bernardetia sp.]
MNISSTSFNTTYWQNRYATSDTPWEIGYASPPLVAYFDKLLEQSEENKNLNILIPGGGSSHEAEYLHNKGFKNVYVLDVAHKPLEEFAKRCPTFPKEHLLQDDFFQFEGEQSEYFGFFDLIIEQTFFCALDPRLRTDYAKKMHQLLKKGGKLTGLLFDFPIQEEQDSPPFGGNANEYRAIFEPYFEIKTLKRCYNSIKPRQGTELFIKMINDKPKTI